MDEEAEGERYVKLPSPQRLKALRPHTLGGKDLVDLGLEKGRLVIEVERRVARFPLTYCKDVLVVGMSS